jgi:hypothetical protein
VDAAIEIEMERVKQKDQRSGSRAYLRMGPKVSIGRPGWTKAYDAFSLAPSIFLIFLNVL